MLLTILTLITQLRYEAILVKDAVRQVDSLRIWSRENRKESAACISKFRMSLSNDGIYTFVIEKLSTPSLVGQDSMDVYWSDLCGDSLPTLHTHLLEFGEAAPSEQDVKVTSSIPRLGIPFELILVLSEKYILTDLIPYSIKVKREHSQQVARKSRL